MEAIIQVTHDADNSFRSDLPRGPGVWRSIGIREAEVLLGSRISVVIDC